MLPTIFVSHGAPTLALQDVPARHFLEHLGQTLERPRAIVAVSAHWETRQASVGGAAQPKTIYDFGRFDDRLFQMRYPAPGDPALADEISDLICDAGLESRVDPARGYDHGIWVPLTLMYPNADIPVVPVSVQPGYGPAHHLALGRAMASLRAQGVLVMASGSFTHDLARFRGQPLESAAPADVTEFADWFDKALLEGRTQDLLTYRTRAPHAAENHPTEEHLLPLYVALGAAGPNAHAEHLHASSTYGILRMDAYAFH
jgi:4,5-DOPA dioxygenase extradiol